MISAPNLCNQYLFLTTTDDTAGGSNPEGSSTSEFFDPAPLLPVELASRLTCCLPATAALSWSGKRCRRKTTTASRSSISLRMHPSGKRGLARSAAQAPRRSASATRSRCPIWRWARTRSVSARSTWMAPQELLQEKSVEIRLDVAYELRVGPNPMRSTANGVLTLREAQTVRAVVYDVLGREVAVVHDGAMETARIRSRLTLAASAADATSYASSANPSAIRSRSP